MAAGLPAQAQIPQRADSSPAGIERLDEVFAPPGTPSVKGKPWVAVHTGPADWSNELHGWLIEDGPKGLLLLDWYGELRRLGRPASDEKRPEVFGKDGTFSFDAAETVDDSAAWGVRPEDFAARSEKFLADGLPDDKDADDVSDMVSQRFGLADHVVDAARFAHFARQLGRKEHATELYAHACQAHREYAERHLGGVESADPLHCFVADDVASGLRNRAIFAAHNEGVARDDLQKRWERIAAIPYHQYRVEARAMAGHYRNLLEEDLRWVEPTPEALAVMTTEQKVAYWLYHLRDLDVGQWADPGRCDVLETVGFGRRNAKVQRPNPAAELEKLGMAAVPQLVAHLDDARPTRCKGHWRRYWPEGHYLLRYGDCCQQVFEAITGHTIFRGTTSVSYPVRDGHAKQCREEAVRWWREYQMKNPTSAAP
jgi:hypothetical protein